jgi:hypothetical protein
MAQINCMHTERIPYGQQEIEIKIPRENYLATLMPRYRPSVKDEAGEIREARPIQSEPKGSAKLPGASRAW